MLLSVFYPTGGEWAESVVVFIPGLQYLFYGIAAWWFQKWYSPRHLLAGIVVFHLVLAAVAGILFAFIRAH